MKGTRKEESPFQVCGRAKYMMLSVSFVCSDLNYATSFIPTMYTSRTPRELINYFLNFFQVLLNTVVSCASSPFKCSI